MTDSTKKSETRISLKEIIQLIRLPNLLIIVFTQYFTAIFLIGMNDSYTIYLFDPNLFLLSASTIIIAAAGYIINDYYDIKIDYINRPDKVVVGKLMKRRIALTTHIVFNFFGVLIIPFGDLVCDVNDTGELIVVKLVFIVVMPNGDVNGFRKIPLFANLGSDLRMIKTEQFFFCGNK